jgi:D-alanyl-D-alanine carboxypeptidase
LVIRPRPLLALFVLSGVLVPVLAHGAPTHATAQAASPPPAAAQPSPAEARAASAKSDLQATLGKLMKRAPRPSGAWVFDATSGETIFGRGSGRRLIPASNTKLLTTSTALIRIGADEKLKVRFTRPGRRGTRKKVIVTQVYRLIRAINIPSDNDLAEGLLRELGARFRHKRTTHAGINAVRDYMTSIGIDDYKQADGSGLSRANKIAPIRLGQLLEAMLAVPDSNRWRASLPVAGHEGTLRRRMRGTAADGACEAKTGTLHDVSALSGYCFHGGRTMVFSILMNGVSSVAAAQKIQDRMVEAIAAY